MPQPSFLNVPYTTGDTPGLFARLLNTAKTQVVRMGLFGDSRATPGGAGIVFPVALAMLATQTFGFAETALSRCQTYGIGSGSGATDNGDWLLEGQTVDGTVVDVLTAAQIPWNIVPRLCVSADFGPIALLDYNCSGTTQKPNPASNFIGIPIANLAGVTTKAQVFAATAAGSDEISWWARPQPTNTRSYFATASASGTTAMGLNNSNLAIKSTTLTLPYSAGNPFMQLEMTGSGTNGARILGARYQSTAAVPSGVVIQPYAIGGTTFVQLTAAVPNWGMVIQALGIDCAILYFGYNDVNAGVTADQMVINVQQAIAAIRLAAGNAGLPVVIFGNNPVTGLSAGLQTEYDSYDGAFATVALADPLVLAINTRRVLEENGITTATAATYTVDGIHPTTDTAQFQAVYNWRLMMQQAVFVPTTVASVPKIIGQLAGPIIDTVLSIGGPNGSVVSTSTICNTTPQTQTFQMWIKKFSAASSVSNQAIYYNTAVPAYDTFTSTIGLTLGYGDEVHVLGSAPGMIFTQFGMDM